MDLSTVTKEKEPEPSYKTPGIDYSEHTQELMTDQSRRLNAFHSGRIKFEDQEIDKKYLKNLKKKYNIKRHELVAGFDYHHFG